MDKVKDRPHLILGQNIATRRRAINLDQGELADKAGTGISGLRDIERGVSEGHIETRAAIAQVLGCQLTDLYIDPNQPPKGLDIAAVAELLSRLADLPLPFQKVAMGIIYNDEKHFRGLPSKVRRPLEELLKAL